MSSIYYTRKKIPKVEKSYSVIQASKWKIGWLSLTAFFVITLPLARISLGPVPLYFADGFLVVSLLLALKRSKVRWNQLPRQILLVSAVFFLFICLSELRGIYSYNFVAPGFYMIFRFCLGISLVIILPRLVNEPRDFQAILKVILISLLVTSSLTILSSLPQTRPLVSKTVFSNKILNPTGTSYIVSASNFRGWDFGIRGSSLVGSVNITGGILCILWPLAFLAYHIFRYNKKWKSVALMACIITPFGAIFTYSRSASIAIASIICLIGIFGYARKRSLVLVALTLGLLIITNVGIYSRHFQFKRLEKKFSLAFTAPSVGKGEYERFLSYSQPFEHLADNLSWLVAGTGCAARKIVFRKQLDSLAYDEDELATHSAFSMVYYNFGLIGAICHALLLVFGFTLISRNILQTRHLDLEKRLTWQALMGVWVGMIPWWLFTPNAGGMARGSTIFFFAISILLAVEKLRMQTKAGSEEPYHELPPQYRDIPYKVHEM